MNERQFKQFKESLRIRGGDILPILICHQKNLAGAGTGSTLSHQPHAWRGSWERPLRISECSQHPFTVARMTDHNVRGRDRI